MARIGSANAVLVLVASVLVTGCGDGFTYVPVKGKVTMNKEPITGGTVVFVPTGENKLRVNASGKLNTDGTYELNTQGKAGVPIGSYVACIQPQMRRTPGQEAPPRRFSDKYINADDNPLKIEVVANPAAGAYDLVVTRD